MHPLSRFLPADFNPTQGITIIAGKGDYPILLAAELRKRAIHHTLIAFQDETLPAFIDGFDPQQRAVIKVGQLGHMLKALRKLGCGYAMMAGQITPKRLFKGLHPDLKAIRILASLPERNAESIFGAIATEIEGMGLRQLDARSFLDDHIATAGTMTTGKWKIDPEHLDHAIRICRSMATLHVGQSIVVNRGTTLAVEAFEGTDAMLRRAATFGAKQPLFVKCVKPAQDYRFDVPVFGPQTLRIMIESGIRHAALEANNVLMLNRTQLLESANQNKIHIHGFMGNPNTQG